MEKLSGFGFRRVGVLTALVALTASLLVVPAEQAAFGSTDDGVKACTGGAENPLFSGGGGTEAAPYLIASADNLQSLANCLHRGQSGYNGSSVFYRQTQNIQWSGNTVIGAEFSSNGTKSFSANYDGGGYAIHGFTNGFGLFGFGMNCTIKNLVVSGDVATAVAHRDIGVLMGRSDGCVFDNVTVYGSASSTSGRVGGLLGYEDDRLKITNSSVHVDVSLSDVASFAGGVVGRTNNTLDNVAAGEMTSVTVSPKDDPYTPETSAKRGSITVANVGATAVGGAIGEVWKVDFTGVHTSIPIAAYTSVRVGGLIGQARALIGQARSPITVADSSSSGAISSEPSTGQVGGLVGWLSASDSVANSHSTSTITAKLGPSQDGQHLGGLVGVAEGPITQSYYAGTINVPSGVDVTSPNVGGLVGTLASSLSKSYANVTFTGIARYPAGLVGRFHDSTPTRISDSFAFGSISGVRPSGLVGQMPTSSAQAAKVTNSFTFATLAPTDTATWYPVVRQNMVSNSVYWNRTRTGPAPGSLTEPSSTQGAVELTDEQFESAASFSGWDFTSSTPTWTMGTCAPYLTWIGSSPQGLCPGVVAPTPAPSPSPSPAPAPTPGPTPAPTPAATPTPTPPVTTPPVTTPPAANPPATPRTPAAPTPPPVANPAPVADPPAPGPGLAILRAEEIFEGAVILGTDTEELIMPAFVLHDIATRLAPEGAPLEEGALLIESGVTVQAVLLVALGDVRLSAADIGDSIQFTLNIPGFDSSSLTVAVQKQALVWAFWAQLGLLGVAAATAMTLVWWFVARGRNRRANPDGRSRRGGTTPLGQPPAYPGGAPGI